mgnify:FL=1|tara:strand:+ start:3442 stop:4425 length:984 start_codon:yes stop_codon:yes gene_type:complete
MSYTAATFSSTNAGVPAGPGDSDSLFLKVFSGEVMATFNKKTVMKERTRIRNIASGSSAQFPAIGKVNAGYHQPGEVILGQAVAQGEKVITIDDLLVTDVFMSNYEDAKNHYEVRGEYTTQMGDALAQVYDQNLFGLAFKGIAAGTAGAVTGQGPAVRKPIGTATPTTTQVVDEIFTGAAAFDSTSIPKEDRCVFVTPTIYWDLIQDGSFLDRDFGNDGNGSQATGGLMRVAGFEVIPTNNMAINHGTDTLSGSQAGSATTDYDINASTYVAMLMQKQALGSVHLMDLASESEYQINRQGTLMVSRMAVGHGLLRPECIYGIDAATS